MTAPWEVHRVVQCMMQVSYECVCVCVCVQALGAWAIPVEQRGSRRAPRAPCPTPCPPRWTVSIATMASYLSLPPPTLATTHAVSPGEGWVVCGWWVGEVWMVSGWCGWGVDEEWVVWVRCWWGMEGVDEEWVVWVRCGWGMGGVGEVWMRNGWCGWGVDEEWVVWMMIRWCWWGMDGVWVKCGWDWVVWVRCWWWMGGVGEEWVMWMRCG